MKTEALLVVALLESFLNIAMDEMSIIYSCSQKNEEESEDFSTMQNSREVWIWNSIFSEFYE